MRYLIPICALLVSSVPLETLLARTWVVDAAGGAGSDFRSIQAAVQAAADGDVIVVRGGAYHEQVRIDGIGLRLIAMPGAMQVGTGSLLSTGPMLEILNLPAQSRVHVLNWGVTRISNVAGMGFSLRDNAGSVWIEETFLDNYDGTALHIENCSDVFLRDVIAQTNSSAVTVQGIAVPAHGTVIERGSRVRCVGGHSIGSHFARSASNLIAPPVGGDGVHVSDSILELDDVRCMGGSGSSLQIANCFQAASGGAGLAVTSTLNLPTAVRVRNGQVFAGPSGFFDANCAQQPNPTPDILDPLGAVTWDPGVSRRLSLPAHQTPSGAFEMHYQGAANDLVLCWIAIQAQTPISFPGIGDELYLPLQQSVVAFIARTDNAGRGVESATFRVPGAPVHLFAQMLMLDTAGSLWFTNPASIWLSIR